MKVNETIFREYDIRGLVNIDLDENFAYVLGQAFGTYLAQKGTTEALVGYDARKTSPLYTQKAIEGILSTGVNVINIGMVTSPMMYWARKYYKKDGGLIITASHNPPEFNGFKPASGNGALFGAEIQKIKDLMINEKFKTGNGLASKKSISEDYFLDIANKVKLKKPLSVIVDCGNATAGPFAPAIFEKLGVKVERLYCDIDSSFPNHPPDPLDPRAYPAIVEKIKKGKYDLGILFDGDADRLGVVDHEGNIVYGDQITALCARKILHEKPGSKVLFEVQCSKSATDDVEGHGGKVILTRVGHSPIEDALLTEKGQLAGETSGHIFFVDRWYGFDDAIYAACRLLELVSESDQTLKQMIDTMPKYISTPQTRIFAPDDRKFEIIAELKGYFRAKGEDIIEIDGIRLEWIDGWAVIRAANTQPQLTLRAEAGSKKKLEQIKRMIGEALAPFKKEGVKVEWGRVH